MTREQVTAAMIRLKRHAEDRGDIPPKCVVARDGGPSMDLLVYCERHDLSLDWVLLGKQPENRTDTKR
ncbi:MAG: hypothetical protein B7X55_13955 [Rhodobacterales bacterium 34-62-10]|nr:MAG: hypothetical protein B7X55_13955 [Rhodobacterales bacterium 34-62-10]